MELSTKKITKAMESYFVKENYKYYPSHFEFDYVSDDAYVYMLVEAHYIIRLPRHMLPEYEQVRNKGSVRYELKLEQAIQNCADMDNVEFYPVGFTIIYQGGPEVVIFKSEAGDIKYIQKKFFTEYYNGLLTKSGFADGITFSGPVSNKHPLIMWNEDNEAIAEFCPIVQ